MLSVFAGFLCIAPETNYGEDAIDLNANPDADLVFLRPYAPFTLQRAVEDIEQDVVRPGFSRHPHVSVPTHVNITAWNMPLYAAPNPGTAGGESPVGLVDALTSAGFVADIPVAGGPLFIRPQTREEATGSSFTAYCWERQVKGSTNKWRLWRLHGCRLETWSIGGALNAVATFEATGSSANFEKDSGETADPWGQTKALEWFDDSGPILDQFGDALAFVGTWQHGVFPVVVTTVARIRVAGVAFPLSQWRITGTNVFDVAPVELDDGTVIQERTIADRTLVLTGTLKDGDDAYDRVIDTVRENAGGDPNAVILGVEIEMNDGRGSGGTTHILTGTLQFRVPQRGDENRLQANTIEGVFTPHSKDRSFNEELTFDNGDASIVRTDGENWAAHGVTVGQKLTPSGTAAGTNDVTFTITTVNGSTLTVTPAPADEVAITCDFTVHPTLLGDDEFQWEIRQTA